MVLDTAHRQVPSGPLLYEKWAEQTPLQSTSSRGRLSFVMIILATLSVRIGGRLSFLLLTFYLGEHFTSASLVTLVLESYYITELILSPIIGGLSDRHGRKPYLVLGPGMALLAALSFFTLTRTSLHSEAAAGFGIVILLLAILAGRLLEGASTGFNVPATLGYLTDATIGSEKLRAKVNTAFEVATVAGVALAIPLAGWLSDLIGTNSFLVVAGIYALTTLLMFCGVKEHAHAHEGRKAQHRSCLEGFAMIRHRRIFTFIPAWFSVNALIGALPNQVLLIMTYPNPAAHLRHPDQLLYGGFSKSEATLWVGVFALIFLLGMGLWMFIVPRMRRSTVMCLGLGGLLIAIIALTMINGLAANGQPLSATQMPVLLSLISVALFGLFLLSGFTPVALSQMSAIAETMPGKRGAVMGLYSVVLGLGQALGQGIGSFFVDALGFSGLMLFSLIMFIIALASVLYMSRSGDDLLQTGIAYTGR